MMRKTVVLRESQNKRRGGKLVTRPKKYRTPTQNALKRQSNLSPVSLDSETEGVDKQQAAVDAYLSSLHSYHETGNRDTLDEVLDKQRDLQTAFCIRSLSPTTTDAPHSLTSPAASTPKKSTAPTPTVHPTSPLFSDGDSLSPSKPVVMLQKQLDTAHQQLKDQLQHHLSVTAELQKQLTEELSKTDNTHNTTTSSNQSALTTGADSSMLEQPNITTTISSTTEGDVSFLKSHDSPSASSKQGTPVASSTVTRNSRSTTPPSSTLPTPIPKRTSNTNSVHKVAMNSSTTSTSSSSGHRVTHLTYNEELRNITKRVNEKFGGGLSHSLSGIQQHSGGEDTSMLSHASPLRKHQARGYNHLKRGYWSKVAHPNSGSLQGSTTTMMHNPQQGGSVSPAGRTWRSNTPSPRNNVRRAATPPPSFLGTKGSTSGSVGTHNNHNCVILSNSPPMQTGTLHVSITNSPPPVPHARYYPSPPPAPHTPPPLSTSINIASPAPPSTPPQGGWRRINNSSTPSPPRNTATGEFQQHPPYPNPVVSCRVDTASSPLRSNTDDDEEWNRELQNVPIIPVNVTVGHSNNGSNNRIPIIDDNDDDDFVDMPLLPYTAMYLEQTSPKKRRHSQPNSPTAMTNTTTTTTHIQHNITATTASPIPISHNMTDQSNNNTQVSSGILHSPNLTTNGDPLQKSTPYKKPITGAYGYSPLRPASSPSHLRLFTYRNSSPTTSAMGNDADTSICISTPVQTSSRSQLNSPPRAILSPLPIIPQSLTPPPYSSTAFFGSPSHLACFPNHHIGVRHQSAPASSSMIMGEGGGREVHMNNGVLFNPRGAIHNNTLMSPITRSRHVFCSRPSPQPHTTTTTVAGGPPVGFQEYYHHLHQSRSSPPSFNLSALSTSGGSLLLSGDYFSPPPPLPPLPSSLHHSPLLQAPRCTVRTPPPLALTQQSTTTTPGVVLSMVRTPPTNQFSTISGQHQQLETPWKHQPAQGITVYQPSLQNSF